MPDNENDDVPEEIEAPEVVVSMESYTYKPKSDSQEDED